MANKHSNESDSECSSAKKMKVETEATKNDFIFDKNIDFSSFEIKRVLQNDTLKKMICMEGNFKGHENESTVVLIEKKSFPTEDVSLKKGFFNDETVFEKEFSNDIYGNYACFPKKEHNGLKVTVIHPATPKHIEKFQRSELHLINETFELYQKVTLPFIESNSFSLEWIDNILAHKAEQDKILYEDSDKDIGFVMLPDLKWNGQIETLKMLAIPFKKIRSIRELNASHLPLLRNIRDAGIAAIVKKYKILESQLRIYFHYQPSFYYLHVHFNYIMDDAVGVQVSKAHLLSTVINNIELMSDYYSKAVLTFIVAESNPLFSKYQELGFVDKVKTTIEKE